MIYLLQIFYYLKYNQPLFNDNLYAWENGIVVYNVHTHFQELYLNVNGREIKDVEDKEIKNFINKCFNYLKTLSDRNLQEFSYNDLTWSTTWTRSSQPDINFTDKRNQEVYQNYYSRWLQQIGL